MVVSRDHLDNRTMWSVGKAEAELKPGGEDVFWLGIPISISGKNIFFDRQVNK